MFPVTCTDCGSPKQGQDWPCPNCGSVRSTVHAAGRAQSFSSATATATIIPYSDTLLAKSRELIDNSDFNIAVVVALIACEIGVESTVSLIVDNKALGYLQEIIFDNYSLASPRTLKIFNALTGEEVQQLPFWRDFLNSVTLRNKTVHRRAGTVTREQAEDAHRAAGELLAYLKKWS
jgi:hypothetical protein